jgi:hypothetical protein
MAGNHAACRGRSTVMDRQVFNGDTAAAGGLIIGIILGSLALNLLGASSSPLPEAASNQPAPRAAGSSLAAAEGAISQR